MAFPTSDDMLMALSAYAGSPTATAAGVAALCDRLTEAEWERVHKEAWRFVPLPHDDRGTMALFDGKTVLWWDQEGRRVRAHMDHMTGRPYTTIDDDPLPC